MSIRIPVTDKVIDVSTGDAFSFGIDLTPWIPTGVTISSVGTVTQENDAGAEWLAEDDTRAASDLDAITDITITGATVNASSTTNHLEETVAASKSIAGTVSAPTHGVLYYVTFPVTLSDAQEFDVVQRFRGTKGYSI